MAGIVAATSALRDPRTVDLWVLPAGLRGLGDDDVRSTLSHDELQHAARLRRDDIRERTTARRYWLRRVLSGYVGVSPAALGFRYGAFGKPRLTEPGPLHFSLSGTHERVVVAVAGAPVGVDAEPWAPAHAGFLRRWTGNEAVVKAIGCGLGHGLDLEIDHGIDHGIDVEAAEPRLVRIGHDDPAAWTLTTSTVAGDTVVSVAVRVPHAVCSLRPARLLAPAAS